MESPESIKQLIEKLTGESSEIICKEFYEIEFFHNGKSIGYSQLNEILLLLEYKTVTRSFFQYLIDQTIDYKSDSRISSFNQFENGVNEFRKIAILLFANIKYGFEILARNAEDLNYHLETLKPREVEHFASRHPPILPSTPIDPHETYLLGYKIEKEMETRKQKNPNDPDLEALFIRREEVRRIGKRNQIAFLASDHLDVYVATSMRLEHEYLSVNRTINSLATNPMLTELKLRWFDPTQAYCEDRIDKGLAEGLMLKRAKCTVYLAQESDTLGKDSELAATLAQGKPVIALVPRGDKKYVDDLIKTLSEVYPGIEEKSIILDQLKVFNFTLAWDCSPEGKSVRNWIENPEQVELSVLIKALYETVKTHYDNRANTLKKDHPLGIQVDLETGVATGVLVVRDFEDCARLIKAAVLKSIKFDIDSKPGPSGEEYTYLIEQISQSIYRVVTGNKMLTNTFWNYYIDEPIEIDTNY